MDNQQEPQVFYSQEQQMVYPQEQNYLFVEPKKKKKRVLIVLSVILCVAVFIFGGGLGAYVFFTRGIETKNTADSRKADFVAFKGQEYATEFKMKSIHRDVEVITRDKATTKKAVVYVFDVENKGLEETDELFNFYGMTDEKVFVEPLKSWEIEGSNLWESHNCRSGRTVLKKGEKSTICLVYPRTVNSLLLAQTIESQTTYRTVRIDDTKSTLTSYQKEFNAQVDFKDYTSSLDRMIEKPKQVKGKYGDELSLPVTYTVKEKGDYTPSLFGGRYLVELKTGLFVFSKYNSTVSDAAYMSKDRVSLMLKEEGIKNGQEIKYYETFDTKESGLLNVYYLESANFVDQATYSYKI